MDEKSTYECTNCGTHNGIQFGVCTNCTPSEYESFKALRRKVLDQKAARERELMGYYLNLVQAKVDAEFREELDRLQVLEDKMKVKYLAAPV